jgi:hypothetical protein
MKIHFTKKISEIKTLKKNLVVDNGFMRTKDLNEGREREKSNQVRVKETTLTKWETISTVGSPKVMSQVWLHHRRLVYIHREECS